MSAAPQDRNRRWLAWTPVLTGLLVGLSYPPIEWTWLAWLALAPLGLLWSHRDAAAPPLAICWLGGAIALAMGVPWMRTCYLDGEGWLGPYTFAWLTIAAIGGGFYTGMVWFGSRLARCGAPMTIVAPVAWTSYEIAKRYGGVFFDQTGFPWATLGSTQADWLLFAQSADIAGEFGLSLLVAATGGAIADMIHFAWQAESPRRITHPRLLGPIVTTVILMGALGYGGWRLAQPTGTPGPTVWLMSDQDLPPFIDSGRLQQTGSQQHASPSPTLLLWPELSWHHKLVSLAWSNPPASSREWPADLLRMAQGDVVQYADHVRRMAVKNARELGATLVLGCEELALEGQQLRRFNTLACVGPNDSQIVSYRKRKLVPWAEFNPYFRSDHLGKQVTYDPGGESHLQRLGAGDQVYWFGPAVCYDLCFASQFWRTSKGPQADFYLHSGAEGQDRNGVLPKFMLQAARLRAIETRRSLVRNAKQGYSGLVDSNGQTMIVPQQAACAAPVCLGQALIDDRWSLYAYTGDGPMMALMATLGAVALWRSRRDAGLAAGDRLREASHNRPLGKRQVAKANGYSHLCHPRRHRGQSHDACAG